MRFATFVVLLALGLVSLPACTSSNVSSDDNVGGMATTVLDAPFGATMALATTGASRSKDYSPAPGDGGFAYWGYRANSFSRSWTRITDNVMYNLFNTNCAFPPYDSWCDSFQGDMTNMMKTIDVHLFNFDWDDPYVN